MGLINYPDSRTIWQRWEYLAETIPDNEAIIHWRAGEEPIRWTYKNLLNIANRFSKKLLECGIKPKDVCAIITKHNQNFYPLYMAIAGVGAIPSILAFPTPRLHPEKFRQGLLGMSKYSGLDFILTQNEIEPLIKPLVESPESTVKKILLPYEWELNELNFEDEAELKKLRENINPEDSFLLQHSSGTTGLQKPVVLSNDALLKHVKQYGTALELDDKDRIVSWLPLYHDMGLIGAFHIPLASGIPSVQIDTFEWIIAPSLLFEAATKEKATICWLPNFAYNLMADKIREDELEGIDLSTFRLIINASEPIRAESHAKFINAFSKYSLNENALSSLYGMAEATLAVTQNIPGKKPREIIVDRQRLSEGVFLIADETTKVTRTCVSSGVLIPDTQIKIVDDNRNILQNPAIGEIAVKSISLFDGYKNNPEKTAAILDAEGWYYSGDIGFIYENELYVIGRKKDIIIFAGKNLYPEDIEDAINQLQDVIHGRVVAFGEDDEELGTEVISIIAETNYTTEEELSKLKLDIIKAGMSIDVNIYNVYLVPPRWLIKSSSGKPARKTNKDRIIARNDPKVWFKKN